MVQKPLTPDAGSGAIKSTRIGGCFQPFNANNPYSPANWHRLPSPLPNEFSGENSGENGVLQIRQYTPACASVIFPRLFPANGYGRINSAASFCSTTRMPPASARCLWHFERILMEFASHLAICPYGKSPTFLIPADFDGLPLAVDRRHPAEVLSCPR